MPAAVAVSAVLNTSVLYPLSLGKDGRDVRKRHIRIPNEPLVTGSILIAFYRQAMAKLPQLPGDNENTKYIAKKSPNNPSHESLSEASGVLNARQA